MNEYYDSSGYPQTGASGSSASMRAELDSVEAGFNKLPVLTGKNNKLVKVNPTATALEGSSVISDDGTNATVSGDLTVAGGNIGIDADSLHTLPNVAADVFTLNSATQTLANKSISGSFNTITDIGTSAFSNDSVTYAKLQNVSATDKLLGRSTAGAGDVEEITCTSAGRALLDDITAADQRTTLGLGNLATQNGTFSGASSGTNTGDQNIFSTIAVSGQPDVIADSASDALTLVAGSNITITTNAATDSITISATSGLTDGDKGDITVSGSGATLTIDNDAVTYTKMQNVTNTARILGRKTAAAGDVEECTLSEVLDFVGSAAHGDILYRDAAGWERLAAGTSGNFLKTQGAGANPTWDAAGGITLLGTLTTTSGTTQTLSGLDLTSYKKIFAVVNGVSFTGNVFITISGNQVSAALGTTFTDAFYGFIDIDLTSSIGLGLVQSGTPSLSSIALGTIGRIFNSGLTAASTSITFAGGTFDAGSIKVYGVK